MYFDYDNDCDNGNEGGTLEQVRPLNFAGRDQISGKTISFTTDTRSVGSGKGTGPVFTGHGFRRVLAGFVLLLVLLVCGQAEAATARGRVAKGLKLMEEDKFLAAATNFVAASELAAGQDRDPAPAHFNAGNALYRAGKLDEALASYTAALDSENLELQSKAYFNLGNIKLRKAGQALKEKMARQAVNLYDQAIQQYEKAITLAPAFMDPKVNYEIGKRDKYELLSNVDRLKSDIDQAKDMIEEHKYVNAVRFMQSKMREHEMAFQLEPELKKSYEELLKRTTDIAKIVMEAEKGAKIEE